MKDELMGAWVKQNGREGIVTGISGGLLMVKTDGVKWPNGNHVDKFETWPAVSITVTSIHLSALGSVL